MSANVEAMVREGINAYKAGRKEEARALLLKATELDQFSEQAWLWLSGLMDSPEDQRTCLENVLAINPNNERAKQGLSYLTGQTSAGNVSPFAANSPPPAPSPLAPTSVEWSSPADSEPAAWRKPAPLEPTPQSLDDWVTNLNLPASDALPGTSPFSAAGLDSGAASPFGDFDVDDDTLGDGPFAASTSDEVAAPARRSQTLRPAPEPPRRARPVPPRENGSLLYDTNPVADAPPAGEMFGYIPPEVTVTRLPGTREHTPTLLVIGMFVLILLNLGLAVVIMLAVLT